MRTKIVFLGGSELHVEGEPADIIEKLASPNGLLKVEAGRETFVNPAAVAYVEPAPAVQAHVSGVFNN
jgi:hypothetical protein